MASSIAIIRIPPDQYIHVLDTNTNVTRVIEGPQTYTVQDHERVCVGPEHMVTVPPGFFVAVNNPVVRDEEGKPVQGRHHQFKLRHGDQEIRMNDNFPEPFPLYPGESLDGEVQRLTIVKRNTCLRLQAIRDFEDTETEDGEPVQRLAGDQWLFNGPRTYIPRVEVEILDSIKASIIKANQALKLRARRQSVDVYGKTRQAGEMWLVRECGEYLPLVDEVVEGTVKATILTEKTALHLRARRAFTDVYGVERQAGAEWLVKSEMATSHICDVDEEEVGKVDLTTLSTREWCVVVDPYVDGVQRLGSRQCRKGETSFFLQPGESLENGIQPVMVLADDESVLLKATERFTDTDYVDPAADSSDPVSVVRSPGDRWSVYGPCEYIPPVEVEVLDRRKAIPLDENEGIYVRDNKSGKVTAVIGQTYMLKPTEELWEKPLPEEVEELLQKQQHGSSYIVPDHYPAGGGAGAGAGSSAGRGGRSTGGRSKRDTRSSGRRDPTRVVTFRVSNNSACQIYDYKAKASRVVFGPGLVMLGPDEQFTILRLSGDKPKRPNVITSLCLMLGPDFMTDVVTVETADHARLNLTLSYNWHFEVSEDEEDATRIFNVRDFVGDACKAIASRVRGAVAAESFDNFHKFSAKIIRGSVFGLTDDNRVKDNLTFNANSLVITNVDVQSVEPVDDRTRESLQKSVQLAIEITTNSQEARAKQEAKREEEEAKGALERQQLINQANAEEARKRLLSLQAESAAVQTQGQAKAEAIAKAEAARIEGEADVFAARQRAEAMVIESEAGLKQLRAKQMAEIEHQAALNKLEIEKAAQLADIETKKFASTVSAIGASTIAEMARAGPEMQAKLLQSLGLKGYMITDGSNPVNLFQTAAGLVAGGMGGGAGGGAGAGFSGGASVAGASVATFD